MKEGILEGLLGAFLLGAGIIWAIGEIILLTLFFLLPYAVVVLLVIGILMFLGLL